MDQAAEGRNGRATDLSRGRPSPVRRPGLPSRRALKNWRVRSRLLLLIAIPIITALVLGGFRITSSIRSAQAYQRVEQLARLSSDVTVLVQRLQDERDQTAYYIAEGRAGSVDPSGAQSVITTVVNDAKVAEAPVKADLRQIGGSFPALTRQEAATALADLTTLSYLRQAAATTNLPALVVVQKYSALIGDLLVLEDSTAQGASDATLSQTVRVLGLVSRMKEDASQQRAILTAALIQQNLDPSSQAALVAAQSDQAANLASFNLSATNAQRQIWQTSVSKSLVPLATSEEDQALSMPGPALKGDPTTADDWYGAVSNEINSQIGSVERQLVSSIINRTSSLRAGALVSALGIAVAVLVVLGLAIVFTVVVARSMTRPLRRLRTGALEVAGVRLPETVRQMSESEGAAAPPDVEPIDVDSIDEIGEVARAFDQVHREAIRLASNEAALRGNVNAMFVNLSRRSQSLVERQIRLIDDLEQGEQDSERLSNLFQMDHLATRMRRNSENLLVLAGHEVARRRSQSVPLVDVLRAAVSEIEQYERVTLNVQPGISVRGQAVNDVVHLIAELAENASSFSAADTPVKVSGHLLNSGGVLLDITDQGVGMGAEEMAHANWRLDNPPVVDVAVSRRMGLFVVARLAARHGIRVRLRPAAGGGLTALVWLPDEVITRDALPAGTGSRRFDSTSPGVTTAAGATGHGRYGTSDWPVDDRPEDRTDAARAVSAARTPRFAPLRSDPGSAETSAFPRDTGPRPVFDTGPRSAFDTGSTPVFDPVNSPLYDLGSGPVPGSGPGISAGSATGPLPAFGVPTRSDSSGTDSGVGLPGRMSHGLAPGGVIVPPAAGAGEEHRLPIFESVESDWFRRGRHGAGRTAAQAASSVTAGWSSPADEGWRAAEAAYAPSSAGITMSGLPKRVPRANLVPGTVGGDAAPPSSTAAPTRSAAQARDRLANFQRGVREGRAAARDNDAPDGEDNSAL